jgi:glycosyltransferase involved in cell wall biosynthesis
MAVRFSVLVPTYNREKHVRQTIESVLAQTFRNFELYVVDDGSTDGTAGLLESYGTRIHALHQSNQGPEVARNIAAARAQGEYLVMLDSDDLLMPCALETYDRVIQALDSPPLLIGSMTYFEDGQSPPAEDGLNGKVEFYRCRDYLNKNVGVGLSNSRIVIRKVIYDEVGGVRNSSPTTFHLDDFNLILRVGTYGPCAVVKSPMTVAYRMHGSNSIRNAEAMVNGILSLIKSERNGQYPGGRPYRFVRYACIGGIAQLWIRRALMTRCFRAATNLGVQSAPMLAAAVAKKFVSRFYNWGTTLISLDANKSTNKRLTST